MSSDDEAARKARAERLRKQIKGLKGQQAGGKEPRPKGGEGEEPPAESPREFIHRKMRDLDEGEA